MNSDIYFIEVWLDATTIIYMWEACTAYVFKESHFDASYKHTFDIVFCLSITTVFKTLSCCKKQVRKYFEFPVPPGVN